MACPNPALAEMYLKNLDGITLRVKKVFVKAGVPDLQRLLVHEF
jgi:hypothetical protein